MKHFMKKVIATVLAFALTISAVGCSSQGNKGTSDEKAQANAKELTKVSIGIDYGSLAYLQVIALQKGYFEENGIDAELVSYAAGIDTLNGIVLNEVQIGTGYDYAACTRLAEKSNLRLAATLLRDAADARWFATTVEGATTAADLKGKTIGILQGTLEEYLWAKELESVGLTAEDVKISYFSSKAEVITALESGSIDAAIGTKEYETQIEAIANVSSINNQGDIGELAEAYVFADETFLTEQSEVFANYLKSIEQAKEFIENNEDEAAQVCADYLTLKKEDVTSSFAAYEYDIAFTQEDYDHINGIAVWCKENGVTEEFEVKDYMNIDAITSLFPDNVTYEE